MAVARGCVPLRRTRYAHPTYPSTGLSAALLLRERLRLTCRGLEDFLRLSGRLRRLSGLRIVPDHSSPWWFARHHLSPEQIEAALRETVRPTSCSGKRDRPHIVAARSTCVWERMRELNTMPHSNY
ncbi:transposase [Geminicoccus sp.]|uniref:transposase n=1 Tax=Geminicoccus sp. TaxID=2024832 RepID=UPI0039C8A0EE